MISAIGVRNVVENQVDFTNSRNLIIAAVILVCGTGLQLVGGLTFQIGAASIDPRPAWPSLPSRASSLNAILPGNDYEFDSADGSDAPSSANLQV